MLSADPQPLCIFSDASMGLIELLPTPRKLLKASVVFFTRTFKEPILKKPISFSVNTSLATQLKIATLTTNLIASSFPYSLKQFIWYINK